MVSVITRPESQVAPQQVVAVLAATVAMRFDLSSSLVIVEAKDSPPPGLGFSM